MTAMTVQGTARQTAAKRAARRKRKFERTCAWGLIILYELLLAATPAAVLAVVLVPIAYAVRGYYALGGEWMLVAAVFCGGYTLIHKRVCDRIFGRRRGR